MAGITVNRVTNANCYLDGVSLLGKVEECTLPEIDVVFSEHKALGMVAKIELPSLGVDKLTGKIKFNSFYRDVMRKAGNPFTFCQLQLRSSVQTFNSRGRAQEVPQVTFLTVSFKKNPMGTGKQHENVELEHEFQVYAIKQVMDGEVLLEFDAMANIWKVGGQDMLEEYRKNIGA